MWRVAAFISWPSILQHLKTNYQHVQTVKRGVVTEKMTYIIDLIIPLWKRFISKATTAESLDIYRFSQTPDYFGRMLYEQPRLPKKMGEVYWSWGLVRYCAKILISFVDGSFQQPSLFIQFLNPRALWTVSQFLLILFSKSSESGNFVFVNVLVLLWYCYLWSEPIVRSSWRKRKSYVKMLRDCVKKREKKIRKQKQKQREVVAGLINKKRHSLECYVSRVSFHVLLWFTYWLMSFELLTKCQIQNPPSNAMLLYHPIEINIVINAGDCSVTTRAVQLTIKYHPKCLI